MKLAESKTTYRQLPEELTLSYEGKIKFIKNCLKDLGYSKELITYLLSTYDLESFIKNFNNNHLELAAHFIGHASQIKQAAENY